MDFKIEDLTKERKAHLLSRIAMWSTMQWGAIIQAPRDGLGREVIHKNALNVPLPRCLTDDVVILSFRVPSDIGTFRLLGYREDQLLQVVWIDQSGRCYRHG
jgi:hypothetical protein